ncbi:MAG TPA: GGDEF domain-containing protein [Acidobacteriaceae bacterium]
MILPSNHVVEIDVLILAGPAISALFAVTFLLIWNRWRELRYLLWFAFAFALFSTAVLSQILGAPPDAGLNAVVSCVLYTLAALFFVQACLMKLSIQSSYILNILNAVVSILIVTGIIYFFYVDRNLRARVYVLNLGLGLLLLITALKLVSSAKKTMDRVLSGALLVFALHFFPRTLLSVGNMGKRGDVATFARSPFWAWLNFSFGVFTVLLGLILLAAVGFDIFETLHEKTITDPLTTLMNRRGLDEFVKHGFSRSRPRSTVLVVCDIDHFKVVNDLYGHQSGDSVLIAIGGLLKESIRGSDIAARLGGEEFVLLLFNMDRTAAHGLIERLRQVVASTQFGSGALKQRKITMSFGVVEFNPGDTLENTLRQADEMLYVAKRSGRNRTCASWLCT